MHSHLKTARILANLLDSQFRIGKFSFGLDPIFGLVPWIGDLFPAILSSYIIWIASRMNVPKYEIFRMIINVVLDLFLGIIPILGDITDFYYKASTKNMKILEKYVHQNVIEGEIVG